MSDDTYFMQSARSLARNPLGIIALFIVLVYAVASIVISLADAVFYKNPYHPAVLFLAIFPLVVLGAFTYLVARHHRKLYAPDDYEDQKDFFFGLTVPTNLGNSSHGVAVSDRSERSIPREEIQTIESKYALLVATGFALLHRAEMVQERTSPKSGRYRVRVWLESIEQSRSLVEIDSVTYHVWRDFRSPVLSTSDAQSQFDLWLSIYGEFPVLALVKLHSGTEIELHRYIDLPGRPPD